MEGRCLEGSSKVVPHTELEVGSREDRRLEEGERGGHGPTTGRGDTEESRRLNKTTNYVISQDIPCPGQDSNRETSRTEIRSIDCTAVSSVR
jgi:hypothetical protein